MAMHHSSQYVSTTRTARVSRGLILLSALALQSACAGAGDAQADPSGFEATEAAVDPVTPPGEYLENGEGEAVASEPGGATEAIAEGDSTEAVVVEEVEAGTDLVDKGTCGGYFHPTVSGGEAAWSLGCSGGNISMVSAWVKDTKADGKCARVKIQCANGDVYYSPKACPKNQVKAFSQTCRDRTLDAWLQVIN